MASWRSHEDRDSLFLAGVGCWAVVSPIEGRPEAILMYFFFATASGGPLFRGPGAKTVFLVARWVVLLLPCFKVRGYVGPDGSWENGHCSPRGQPSGDLGCLHACSKHDCERLSS